jgi:isopentenyl-diphosphate Delta-isomerase
LTAVVLVDERDVPCGTAGKLEVHQTGVLHRACSVFVFDAVGRLLLQRRALGKYHSGGCWSNTCCGHPLPGESPLEAAHRRLREEMGFDCTLRPWCEFRYQADLGDGLVEHEYDHVFVGRYDRAPMPNLDEVGDWAWASLEAVQQDIAEQPDRYTKWFPIALACVIEFAGHSLEDVCLDGTIATLSTAAPAP